MEIDLNNTAGIVAWPVLLKLSSIESLLRVGSLGSASCASLFLFKARKCSDHEICLL